MTLPSGLVYWDLKVGTGAVAAKGSKVKVNYTGWLLEEGTKFDSSYDRDEPFEFTLGAGKVIKGWDLGVAGMKVGGKRQLRIPPELGLWIARTAPGDSAQCLLDFRCGAAGREVEKRRKLKGAPGSWVRLFVWASVGV